MISDTPWPTAIMAARIDAFHGGIVAAAAAPVCIGAVEAPRAPFLLSMLLFDTRQANCRYSLAPWQRKPVDPSRLTLFERVIISGVWRAQPSAGPVDASLGPRPGCRRGAAGNAAGRNGPIPGPDDRPRLIRVETERISVATRSSQESESPQKFRLTDAEMGGLFDAINRSVADETHLMNRLAVVRQGETLTERLAIAKEKGWFQPMLNDLLRQGVSVVINDIQITDATAHAIGRHADLPPDWVTQQNLYVTPGASRGFDPHCDPHVVVVAHLYGRKEWTLYDKVLENPVYDSETNTVADKSTPLGVRSKIMVAPGDCFVIPRGRYHSAVALSPASVHMAVGAAGARPVDYIWTMADQAIHDPMMRADMTPEDALEKARDFMARFALEPVRLPRFPRAAWTTNPSVSSFSFKEILDALPGG